MVSGNRHSELAEKFSAHENYVEATREYLEAIQTEPSDPNLYIRLGEVLVHRRQYQEAAEKYWKAIELGSDSAAYDDLAQVLPRLIDSHRVEKYDAVEKRIAGVAQPLDAYKGWAAALYGNGLYSEAAEMFKKAASLDHADADAVCGWGDCFAKMGKREEALKKYEEALKIKPHFVRAHVSLAAGLFEAGSYSQAMEHYLKVMEEDLERMEDNLEGIEKDESTTGYDHWNFAWDHISRADKKTIQAKLDRHAAKHPEWAEVYLEIGRSFYEQKRYPEAIEQYENAHKTAPSSKGHWYWADALSRQGNYGEAITHYLEALCLSSERHDFDEWIGAFDALSLADRDEAVRKLEEIVCADPEKAFFYRQWGRKLFKLGRYPEAAARLEQAAKALPSDNATQREWANALFAQGPEKYEAAIERYLQTLSPHPGTEDAPPRSVKQKRPDFHKLIMALQGLPPDKQQATGARLEQIVTKYPQRDRVYSTWARILYDQEKFGQSAEKYREALKSAPENSEVVAGLAKALAKQKKYAEAVEQFSHAAKLNLDSVDNDLWFQAIDQLPQAEREKKYLEVSELLFRAAKLSLDSVDNDLWFQAINQLPQEKREKKYLEISELLRAGAEDLASIDYALWGRVLDALGKSALESEIDGFHQLARNKPEAAEAYFNWGESLYSRKRYAEAAARYQKACELNPEYAKAFIGWGDTLRDARQYSGAEEKYKKVTELQAADKDNQANAWAGWAYAFQIRGAYSEAIQRYQMAVELDAKQRFAYRNYGDILSQRKQFAEAGALYEKNVTEVGYSDADSYLAWGSALLGAKKEAEARQKYEQALAAAGADKDTNADTDTDADTNTDADTKLSPADCYYYWGNALAAQDRIEEALEKYQRAIDIDPEQIYAYNNMASYLEGQGRYSESLKKWDEAIQAYERGRVRKKKNGDVEYFFYFGGALKDLKPADAEEIYLLGLEIDPEYLDILIDLTDLYLRQRDELIQPDRSPDYAARTVANSKARECYRKAEDLLKRDFAQAEDTWWLVRWGDLYLSMAEYDKAAVQYQKAVDLDNESAEPLNQLGVLSSRKEDFAKAIQYFEQALQRDSDNLKIKSNLAEAYLKGGKLDKAESQYKAILSITAKHVESEIGLGQVYTAMAESCRDGDFYEEAIHHFRRAIVMAKNNSSGVSKKMTSRELAAVYYASGYARVKLHGASKTIKDDRLLWDARKDFKQSLDHDKENHKAARAAKKITEKLQPFSPERFLEKVGPMTILVMSAFVFVLVQVSFLRKGTFHDLRFYVPVTFGSIVLMIAGFYLPRLLKLKVAGIELEKSSVDQITSAGSLEISQ